LNARSLNNKKTELHNYLEIYKPKVVCITETWLVAGMDSYEYFPSTYSIYRRDRPSRGGGVLIAVHDSLPNEEVIQSAEECEFVGCKVRTDRWWTIIAYYRPGAGAGMRGLSAAIAGMAAENIILTGDFKQGRFITGLSTRQRTQC